MLFVLIVELSFDMCMYMYVYAKRVVWVEG